MPTSIDSNPFPLGFVTGTPGTPVQVTANIPDFDCPYVNTILFQAGENNRGKCYLGNTRLDVAAKAGRLYTFMVPGDALTFSVNALNTYKLADFRLDFQIPGDGVWVSVCVR